MFTKFPQVSSTYWNPKTRAKHLIIYRQLDIKKTRKHSGSDVRERSTASYAVRPFTRGVAALCPLIKPCQWKTPRSFAKHLLSKRGLGRCRLPTHPLNSRLNWESCAICQERRAYSATVNIPRTLALICSELLVAVGCCSVGVGGQPSAREEGVKAVRRALVVGPWRCVACKTYRCRPSASWLCLSFLLVLRSSRVVQELNS